MLIQKDKNFYQSPKHNFLQINNAPSWVEIDKSAFEHNVFSYKKIVHPTKLISVIKSNAYGHGIEQIANICDQSSEIDLIGVVSLQEALLLRFIKIKKSILVLSIPNGDMIEAVEQNIDLVAYDINTILELNNIGKKLNKKVAIHIKVDTGLSRLGLCVADVLRCIEQVNKLPFINIRGLFTHFAESEAMDQTFTNHQIELFNSLCVKLEEMNIDIPLKHAACSAAIIANKNSHFNAVRVGIGLYGLWPSCENKQISAKNYPEFYLRPVLKWKTKIIQIKDIPSGSFVGYDRTYQVNRDTRLAVLPVGYWDGYDKRLSNKGKVLINGQLAPVVGRIAMNLCMVDITGLDVSINDDVTLLGDHFGVTADDIAQHCQTINYEIVSRINPMLPRFVI